MKRKHEKESGADVRTWGFAAGAAALLALLTVVLCILGGVFHFVPSDGAATPTPNITAPPAASAAAATAAPEATARPAATLPPQTLWTVSVVAGKGGSVSPTGILQVATGDSVTFTITPDEGYVLAELKVDGADADLQSSYTLTNVTANHSLYAVFRLAPESPAASPSAAPEVTPASPSDLGG